MTQGFAPIAVACSLGGVQRPRGTVVSWPESGLRSRSPLAVLALAASASAAVTVGQAPPSAGASFGCGPGTGLQLSVAGGNSYAVPSPGGVITHWRSSASGTIAMTVFQGAGTTWTPVVEDQRTIAGTLTQFDVRIPVAGGEQIGMRIPGATPGCLYQTSLASDLIGVAVVAPLGVPTPFVGAPGYRFNVAVDVEPDADKDGFGDETQDACPTDAARQGPCPDTTAPQTSIRKHPAKKTGKRKARFTFSSSEPGSSFECKLDKKPFKKCASPFRKRVGPGHHSFRIRARDAAGNRDASAAKFGWTVQNS